MTLVDDASTGLANIRAQLTQLTQTAGQVQTALTGVAASAQQVGQAHQQATPHVSNQEKALKELTRSAEETTRGLVQMGLAARRGAEAFPELALATREAWTGLKGVNVAMGELGAASRLMVVGLGAVVVGIGAIGAAVVAYGVSVFKFSQEMFTLSQTAKSLGMTFGQLRNITEQNERFGISTEATIASLGKMNEALTDLSLSGSKLRQQLMSQGVGPKWIDEFARETDDIDRINKIREGQIIVYNDLRKRFQEPVARTLANRFATQLGGDPTAMDRPALEKPTAEQLEQSKRIAAESEKIAAQWRETLKIISDIKTEFLSWGLPAIAPIITGINEGLKTTEELFTSIGATIRGIKSIMPDWLVTAIGKTATFEKGALGGLITGGPIGALRGGYRALQGDQPTEAAPAPAAPTTPEAEGGISGWYHRRYREKEEALKHPSSYRGANDNINPLLHNASFGGSDTGGSSGEGRAQAIIKGGVYEALVEFYGFLQGGAKGGGAGGGIQNASLTTGNIPGAGGGGSADIASSFGSKAFPNLGGGGNAAGSAGLPGGYGGGGGGGGGGSPHGSHVGAGAGEGAGDTPVGAPGGGGDTSKVGNEFLASQRARLTKELNDDPELKRRAAAIMQTENVGIDKRTGAHAGTAVIESAMNRAIMSGRSLRSVLSGGPKSFYGPARRGQIEPTMRSMSANTLAQRYREIDAATGGSNLTLGATDQGSAGDPNYSKGGTGVNINRERFNDWGGFKGVENSRRWRLSQQEQVNKSAAAAAATTKASEEVKASAAVPGAAGPGPVSERYSTRALRGEDGGGQDQTGGGQGGADTEGTGQLKRIYIGPQSSLDRGALDRPLDRSALNDNSKITSTGSLSVDVNAPPGTKVNYNGDNLLRATSMQRQTQMMPTDTGPSVGDAARSSMRGGT